MRILFVVQRYGPDIAGGSERCARDFARHLAERGHDVHALTSRARSYRTWENVEPAGVSVVEGVTIHRLSCAEFAFARYEGVLSRTVGAALIGDPTPVFAESSLAVEIGPRLIGFDDWLGEHGPTFDVAVVVTYLFFTGWRALPVLKSLGVATVFHPTAHPESALLLDTYAEAFRAADMFGFLTPEEDELVRSRFRVSTPGVVHGIGVELDGEVPSTEVVGEVCSRFGLGSDPYVVYVGRIDKAKGVATLVELARTRELAASTPVKFVLVGDGDALDGWDLPATVVRAGFLSDKDMRAVVRGAVALVLPSAFESFSMVCTEAWALRRPVLVSAASAVLVGQARRSGGGLWFASVAELDAAIDMLIENPVLADALGEAGRRYCEANYHWPDLLDRYEAMLRGAIERMGRNEHDKA